MMQIIHFNDWELLDAYAAQTIINKIQEKPNAVLGLATGSTPLGIYAKIIEAYRSKEVSFAQTTTVNLDEYVGLPAEHEQSYAYYMKQQLFSHIDIADDHYHLPNGLAENLKAECDRYDQLLEQNPIDIQLLGLGHNGHIGFNEPDALLSAGTHAVQLKAATLEANARFFSSAAEVPKMALTMGVGSILKAHTIILVVRGADKAEIVEQALTGPITTDVPASLLQTHPRVIVLLDREAGRKLK